MVEPSLTVEQKRLLRGLAAGDRNGGPIRLALLLFNEVKNNGFTEAGVFKAYFDWVTNDGFDTGPTLRSVCKHVAAGHTVPAAVEKTHLDFNGRTSGIGPAHRATPLALFYRDQADTLDRFVKVEARLSHFSPVSGEVAMVSVRICAHLLKEVPFEDSVNMALRGLSGISLEQVPVYDRYSGGHAPRVLQTAVSFIREATCFREALENSLTFAGPSNYSPVLVGVIGACRFGDVPEDLLAHAKCPEFLRF